MLQKTILSSLQFEVEERTGADPFWAVALQARSGAARNTIWIHNGVADLGVAGLVGGEGQVIRRSVMVFIDYTTAAGILRMLSSPDRPSTLGL